MAYEKLKIAISCVNSLDNIQSNINIIEKLTQQASQQGAEIVFFPENVLFMRVKEGSDVPFFQENDPYLSQIKKMAQDFKILIHLGSVPFKVNNKHYNSSLVFNIHGKMTVLYSKIHLFDIQLTGQPPIRESDVFERGEKATCFTYKSWSFAQSICYDIRFSELYNKYAKNEVDVILIPAAFLKTTGEAHWHVLNRARAIESQCYVVSSAQGGLHKSTLYPGLQRETFGHALVVDPWGRVEIDNHQCDSIQVIELSKEKISIVRTQIPMTVHRKSSSLEADIEKHLID